MANRPEFCETANCPAYTSFCRMNEDIIRMWPSRKGREKERERLTEIARTQPKLIEQKCSMPQTQVIFRK